MSEDKPKDALAKLSAFADGPRQVSVGGQLYDLCKLRPIDLAEARDFVVRMRIERHLTTTRHMTLEPAVRAQTMAAIECHPLSLYDVAADPLGRIKLIHASLVRAGANLSVKQVQDNLEPTMQDQLYAYVLWISGVIESPDLEEHEDGPLSTPTDSTVSPGT